MARLSKSGWKYNINKSLMELQTSLWYYKNDMQIGSFS